MTHLNLKTLYLYYAAPSKITLRRARGYSNMGRRNKSTFEKWFSLQRHKRRAGAKKLNELINNDYEQQKKIIIDGKKPIYTHGSSHDISQHFSALEKEFVGQSQLCYTHAKLIVLLRREYNVESTFQSFVELWEEQHSYLLKELNTRWLVAAADSFSDHSKTPEIQAAAVACSCLINTIKLQETERFITDTYDCPDISHKVEHLQNENRLALFDGTSGFAVGTDDTLRNMRWRIDKLAKQNIAGKILKTVFIRIQYHDNVYYRFKNRHTRKKTMWW